MATVSAFLFVVFRDLFMLIKFGRATTSLSKRASKLTSIYNFFQNKKKKISSNLLFWNNFFGSQLLLLFLLMGCLMTSFLPSTGRSLDYLLLKLGLISQSVYRHVFSPSRSVKLLYCSAGQFKSAKLKDKEYTIMHQITQDGICKLQDVTIV